MAATNNEKPKKSFEFRMSKKVAELTQVVHMLFTRNHEKEVEIDALKKAYEKEIDIAIQDARGRISKLEKTVEEQSSQNENSLNAELRKKEEEMAEREADWQRKLSESERLLQEERGENRNLRDLLINAQADIEKLRQGVSDELVSKSDEIRRRDREVERLANQLCAVESDLRTAQSDAQGVIADLRQAKDKLEEDLKRLQAILDANHKQRDQVMNRNKQLEQDMSALKREFTKRASEMAANQLKNAKNNMSSEMNLELERLRREVQRYRLELSNRDVNFNRMFTEKQPLLVNQRNNTHSTKPGNNGAIYTSFNNNNNNTSNGHSLGSPQSFGQAIGLNGNLLANGSAPGTLKDRLTSRASIGPDLETIPSERLQRQVTAFSERVRSSDRRPSQGFWEGVEVRPSTQGASFVHEQTVMRNGKDKSRLPRNTTPEDDMPHQLLPKRQTTSGNERPESSSLPSICSTPERRKPLVKPKPLPRELLYGK